MKKIFSVFVLLLATAILIISCGPSNVVVRERPVAPVYVRPLSPGPNYIWIDGNYVRNGRGYVYKQGYWAAPRRTNRAYTQGYWRNTRRGYVWVPGRW